LLLLLSSVRFFRLPSILLVKMNDWRKVDLKKKCKIINYSAINEYCILPKK